MKNLSNRIDLELLDRKRERDNTEKDRLEAARYLKRFFQCSNSSYKNEDVNSEKKVIYYQ